MMILVCVQWPLMTGVVHLWTGWGLQILVLVSFMLQAFLLIFARMRRQNISIIPRTLLWLAYLLADYIAVYILGHMSFCGKSHGHQQLMAFWAPFLLVHLGGQDNITAYSIEDSQLWPRHLLSFVGQTVGVAYVLYKYVSGSWTLVTAAVLIFVSGVLKYGERVWALRSSSLDNVSKFIDSRKLSEAEREPRAQCGEGEKLDPEEVLQGAHDLLPICMGQLVDYKFWPSTFQSESIKLFDNKHQMFELVEMQLSLMYDFLYTKASVVFTWYGCFIRAISSIATITAFFLFHSSIGKNDFNRVDAIVTYILIVGAVLLEMTSLLKAMGSTWACALLRARRWHRLHSIVVRVRRRVKVAKRNRRWSGSIGQPELSNSSHGSGCCLPAQCLGCKDLWKKLHHSSPVISNGIKKVVLEEVCRMVGACKGNEDIMRSYSGQCALSPWHRFFEDPTSRAGIDFDDKILSWYFATKMFLSESSRVGEQDYVVEAITTVSNYMIFLLVERPYMLPSPVRSGLYGSYEATCVGLNFYTVKDISRRGKLDNRRRMWDLDTRRDGDELERVREKLDILREELDIPRKGRLDQIMLELDQIRLEVEGSNKNSEELSRIMKNLEDLDIRSEKLRSSSRPSAPPAMARVAEIVVWMLEVEAQGEQDVYQVVLGVWVEMLCYAAHHCSRDSHARQLNSGGELITIVWLLSTAMFNRRYCDEPWFKKGVDEFFRSPFHVKDKCGWLDMCVEFWVMCCLMPLLRHWESSPSRTQRRTGASPHLRRRYIS
ncbi:hypothetical protein ZWY2020_036861 [Hordeum vulgare]|nr:hypothetical protein ZWY2020_036861 [Hordeum vulgare]